MRARLRSEVFMSEVSGALRSISNGKRSVPFSKPKSGKRSVPFHEIPKWKAFRSRSVPFFRKSNSFHCVPNFCWSFLAFQLNEMTFFTNALKNPKMVASPSQFNSKKWVANCNWCFHAVHYAIKVILPLLF